MTTELTGRTIYHVSHECIGPLRCIAHTEHLHRPGYIHQCNQPQGHPTEHRCQCGATFTERSPR